MAFVLCYITTDLSFDHVMCGQEYHMIRLYDMHMRVKQFSQFSLAGKGSIEFVRHCVLSVGQAHGNWFYHCCSTACNPAPTSPCILRLPMLLSSYVAPLIPAAFAGRMSDCIVDKAGRANMQSRK